MAEPHLLTGQPLHTVQQRNGSTTAATSRSEDSVAKASGIIPAAIAATLFIAFILALYTVLWRCMVSPPQRKHSRVRMRGQPRVSV
ncbi:uncharacterized protein sb:cb288 isoform X2 [Acanthopagrus latus]|nr:uncharacterized protein sb:cb288 isoform X2 [Acanthopagrus latus]